MVKPTKAAEEPHKPISAPVQQREVHLLEHLLKLRLHEHHTLAVCCLPHVGEVVDAMAPEGRGETRPEG